MDKAGDFVIKNNMLEKYVGSGGDVVVPDGVTSIGDDAFSGCSSLTSVIIPDSVTIIRKGAFSGCSSLTSVTIPDSVTTIRISAFRDCSSLTNVTIPDGVTTIGYGAFCGCKSLTSVTIPDSVVNIGDYVFEGCAKAIFHISREAANRKKNFTIESGVLKKYVGPGGDVVVPDDVTSIGEYAFSRCSSLMSVTLPNKVTSIGEYAFSWCSNLISVTFPDKVINIEKYAFSGCNSLASLTLPDSVTTIGEEAFRDCSSLTNVKIPDGVTNIGDNAFGGCDKAIFHISREAANRKENFIIESGVLKKYVGPGGDVVVPDNVMRISEYAFTNCSTLTSVTIPDSVKKIEGNTFSGCAKAIIHVSREAANRKENFIIESGVLKKYIGSGGDVVVPDSVTSIGEKAFMNCSGLTNVTIPDSVTSIGDVAFWHCSSLINVTIPDSVTNIGHGAFSHCSSLKSIQIKGSAAKLTNNIFDVFGFYELPMGLIPQIASLHVHMTDGALKQYVLTNSVWKKIPPSVRAEIFLTRQSKALNSAYTKCVEDSDLEELGEAILNRLSGEKPTSKECNAAAAYMTLFHTKVSTETLKAMYGKLKLVKAGTKSVKAIEDHVTLMEKLGCEINMDVSLSSVAQKVIANLIEDKQNKSDLEKKFKDYYSLTFKDLPILRSTDGNEVEPLVLAWLFTVHEQLIHVGWGQVDVVAAYQKAGLSPKAEEIVALLDSNSLQAALLELANVNLGLTGRSKKMFLAYPICRYAGEELMVELCSRAPKWRSSVSGNDAPPLWTFRHAGLYSDTRAAMLFAERYNELDDYAKVRGLDSDTIRDQFLSNVGLDEQGGKYYDLGSQTVTAWLQNDFSFCFELPNGKTSKSLPKKNADPVKYAVAYKDFSEMKKSVKKILNSRGNVLFKDFMSGRERLSAEWKNAYMINPLLRKIANLVIWAQGKKSFIISEKGAVDSTEQFYHITDAPIRVAHPMEMTSAEIIEWQNYFITHNLKQPFAQIWEPVREASQISENRYKDCVLEIYQLSGKDKHGIHSFGIHAYSEDFGFYLDDCELEYDVSTSRLSNNGASGETYTLGRFTFPKFNRQVNHIVSILDGLTIATLIKKDDITAIDLISEFTLAQIKEFINLASEANAINVLAALMEYKNSRFANFDPMEELTLEW